VFFLEEEEGFEDFEEQQEKTGIEYQKALEELRKQQDENFVAVPETDLEFESRIIEPGLNVQDIFDKEKFGKIKAKILNLLNSNLSTSNYDDKTLREMRLHVMAAIKVLDAMNVSGLDLSPAYNEIVLIMQSDATLLKARGGWANIMRRSTFSESTVLEKMVSEEEKEQQRKKFFNFPFFTRAQSGTPPVTAAPVRHKF